MMNMIEPKSREDRAVGAFVGLAVGDALGTSVEFMTRGHFAPVTGMRGGGMFGLQPGGWTDDTSMALALGEALLQDRALADPAPAMNRWVNWFQYGMYSHTGACFDIGSQTRRALTEWNDRQILPQQDTEGAGNGGIMSLAPAVLANLHDRKAATEVARRQSDFTHRNAQCRHFAGALADILYTLIDGKAGWESPRELAERKEPDVASTGYVVDTFEAALWAAGPDDGFAGPRL